MEQENLVDIMYEALSERINVPKKMKEKALKRYEEINSRLSKEIENNDTVIEILGMLDDFLDVRNAEVEYEKREYYKRGLLHYELLKNELTRDSSILENKQVKDKILDKIYESDIENIAVLSNKEKNECEKNVAKIIFSNIPTELNENDIKKIERQIEKYVNNIYLECAYLCQKNYKYGFKRCFNLKLASFKNT